MSVVTGYSEPIIKQWIHIKKESKSEKKIKYQKCNFFKTSRNVLPPSRPAGGVKKNGSLLGRPVDSAGLVCSLWHSQPCLGSSDWAPMPPDINGHIHFHKNSRLMPVQPVQCTLPSAMLCMCHSQSFTKLWAYVINDYYFGALLPIDGEDRTSYVLTLRDLHIAAVLGFKFESDVSGTPVQFPHGIAIILHATSKERLAMHIIISLLQRLRSRIDNPSWVHQRV